MTELDLRECVLFDRVHAALLAAAAVAAALMPGIGPEAIVEAALAAAAAHRVEGPQTRAWQWYEHAFQLNERLITEAVALAQAHRDVFAVQAPYYRALHVSDLGSEAAQTVAVALGMLVAAEGDLRQAIIGCVNYGRDNDSYATLAGAIAGAMHGIDAIPSAWRETVAAANPDLDLEAQALALTRAAVCRHQRWQGVVNTMAPLVYGPSTDTR